ncbi:MAG: hypothetical protein LC676_08115 [Loktanella sp.]|nr:hypothetical protein [Loktanella sp.]
MTDWEQPMTYMPSKGAARMMDRMQAQIDAALADLRYRGDRDAATAFAAMTADDLTRREVTVAVTGFHLSRAGAAKVRQGDVCDPAAKLRPALADIDDLTDRLYRACHAFRETPGLPEPYEIANFGQDASVALLGLADLADKMCRAVIAAHGEDTGGPALSDRLTDDPLDRLADDLAGPWRRHGQALTGRGLNAFMDLLRAVHAAETKHEAIPERAEKRIRAARKAGHNPP